MDETVGRDASTLCKGVRKTGRAKKEEMWFLITETRERAVLLHDAGMQSKDVLDLSQSRAKGVQNVSASFSNQHWLRAVPWAKSKCVGSSAFVLLYTCTQNTSRQKQLSPKRPRYLPLEVTCTAIR